MRNQKAKTSTTDNSVTWMFGKIGETFTASLDNLSEAMIRKLAIHGLKQKGSDSYAGKDVSVTQAFQNVHMVYDMLKDDEWTSGVSRTSILSRAISRLTGKMIEDCIETIANLGKDELTALKKSPKVRAMIAQIQLDDAKDSTGDDVDLDGLFDDDLDA